MHSPADALGARMPFPDRALSVDNGSEFMAEFEAACAERAIALLTLPPRSPRLHGSVGRANRTHTEGLYTVTDAEPDLASLQLAPRDWEDTYNRVRPYRALGYLTPSWRVPGLAGAPMCRGGSRRGQPVAFHADFAHTPRTMQITTVAWLMQMRRRPRRVEDGVLGA